MTSKQDAGRWLLTGGPGSGKTRKLRERFATLVEGGADPERIALFVLTRRAAREARMGIAARLGRSLPALPVFTAHGYAFGLLRRRAAELGYDDEPVVLSAADQYAAVRELLAGEEVASWPRFGHLLDVAGFARQVADFILRAQERLLTPEDLPPDEVVAFYRRYLDVQSGSGRTDFAGLLVQATALLQASVGEEDRFDHILVDDYQDATVALEAIVAALAPAATSVTVAADPDGHVFSYRGGSIEPLERIAATLPGIETTELAESVRAGVTAARVFAHPGEEADAVAHELLTARVDEDVPWERMAVVVRRYGAYLPALRHALTRHGIPHIVVGEAAAIAVEPAVAPILDLIRYALRPELRDDLVEPVLGSAAGGLDPHRLRQLRREARVRRLSVRALAESTEGEGLPPDLAAALAGLRELTGLVGDRAGGDPAGLFFELWSRLPSSSQVVAEERHRDLDALAALGDIVHRFVASRPAATIGEWLATIEAAEFGPDPWVAPEERHPSAVRVTTAHRAHGTEFDVVCIAGCVEGEFPSPAHSARLVDLDRIVDPASAGARLAAHLAEEGRLFRLASSRARTRTVLFASHSTSSTRPRTQSRYAARLGVEWTDAAHNRPTSLRAIEASLHGRVADTTQPAPSRLAAVAAAAEASFDTSAWWGGRAWTDPGVPLYAEEILTSYSRLSTLENCGLQYLYQVEMGLDPESTHSMWVGVLIHDIIDRAQRGEIPRTLDGVLVALEEGWDPDVFPSRAIESRRHQDCKEMLQRWIDGEKAEVVHSEVSFRFPLDGAWIRGKIDAIFRMENGHLRIVDYKTGRYAPPQKGIEENLQLAAYYLATVHDPELRMLGTTGYMQLAFPGKEAFQGPGYTMRGTNVKPGYREWAEEQLINLVADVRAENFAPSPEADCKWCDFKVICPLWPQGSDAGVQR